MIKTLLITTLTTFSFHAFANNAPEAASALTDGQIAEAVVTINEGEIDAAQAARSRAKSKDVKDFAKMMIDHHKDNKNRTKDVAKKEKLDTEDSNLSEALEKEAKDSNKEIKKKKNADFDRAYMNQQVTMHKKALSMLDDVFIPQSKNQSLRTHLEETRKSVNEHLLKAQALQTQVRAE